MIELIKKYGIKAKKSLGQNFLINKEILNKISEIIEITNKNIIEVGPGFGALTEKILEKNPKNLTLVELDKDMIKILNDRIKNNNLIIGNSNFKIENIDILEFEPNYKNYSVIANIPYYITSPILRHFLYETKEIPENMVILMQKDVGDKILKTFDENKIKSSLLGLLIAKKAYTTEKLFVSKKNFIPSPKVESSVLLFKTHKNFEDIDDKNFLNLLKIGFSANRKKLIKNLEKGGYKKENLEKIFEKLNIDFNSRAENLGIKKWCELTQELKKF